MGHRTWVVVIQLTDTGEEVTASARLHGTESAIGIGSVRQDNSEQDLDRDCAQAARLALEDLGTSLGYLAGTRRYASIDRA